MITARITVSAPVLLAAGEFLNGKTLSGPEWVRSGEAEVSIERAEALERDGYADILSKGVCRIAGLHAAPAVTTTTPDPIPCR